MFSVGVDAYLACLTVFYSLIITGCILQPISVPLQKSIVSAIADNSQTLRTFFCGNPALALLAAITVASLYALQLALTDNTSPPIDFVRMTIRPVAAFGLTFACLALDRCLQLLSVDGGEGVMKLTQRMEVAKASEWKPLPKSVRHTLLAPFNKAFSPMVHGSLDTHPLFKQVASKRAPLFFVSNHCLLGLEMPLLMNELNDRNIKVRGLGDFGHWLLPGWRHLLELFGAVPGSRENVKAMFNACQDLLVYPGGGHEVMKHSSVPRYQLLWKERLGFARCAIESGATIVPCCSVGTEDMLHTVADVPADMIRKGLSVPLSVPTSTPERVHFWFGEPIRTDGGDFGTDPSDTAMALKLRDITKASVEEGITLLQKKQAGDPLRFMSQRIAADMRG